MPSWGGQRYDRSDSWPPVQGLPILYERSSFPHNRFESQLFPIFSHVLRDGSGVASSGKELSGCQAGAASGTTAPTPGRPYRAYRFFTNEAHFRITDSSHNLFPFFHTFYATAAV